MRILLTCAAWMLVGCEAIAGYGELPEPAAEPQLDGSVPIDTGAPDAVVEAADCVAPLTRCGTACVDLRTSFDHCGACGRRCPVGATCAGDGECACPSGQSVCGDRCVDTSTDKANCGACGAACGTTWVCAASSCQCPAGSIPCDGTCVVTAEDPRSCGACGTSCAALQACSGGACACMPGFVACAGACVDTASDPQNCGGCGVQCPSGQVCNGKCRVACTGGETKCAVGGAFACANLARDTLNCGACGTKCGAGELCVAGSCRAYAPAPGCTSCPCATCGAATTCCPPRTGTTNAICVTGTGCP